MQSACANIEDVAGASRRKGVAIAWTPPAKLDQAIWMVIGQRMGAIDRCSKWWLGDWLRYGADQWGAKYVAAAKLTGYDPHSLENMVYVASRFPFSLRRENLRWSHHFVVAACDHDEQAHWLDLAAEQKLSVQDLRIELLAARRGHVRDRGDRSVRMARARSGEVLKCPNCGEPVPLPALVIGRAGQDRRGRDGETALAG